MEFPDLPLIQCGELPPSPTGSTTPTDSNSKLVKETKRWRDRIPLPEDINRSDICAQVDVSSELKIEDSLLGAAKKARNVVRDILGRSYTAPQHSARFHLKVFVVMLSDGGMVGTMKASEKSFTWLGEAVVTFAWRLYSKDSKIYDGGTVTVKRQLEYGEFFDPLSNLGSKFATEVLARESAYEIVQKVGISNTKFYFHQSSAE